MYTQTYDLQCALTCDWLGGFVDYNAYDTVYTQTFYPGCELAYDCSDGFP